MCRYGVEEEGGYVFICRYVSIWGGGRGGICVDMGWRKGGICVDMLLGRPNYDSCGVVLDSRQGEELGESYLMLFVSTTNRFQD
jgi:hypothetical protein